MRVNAHWLRKLVLFISTIGLLLFGGAFVASLLDPLLVERAGRELIRIQVQKKIGEQIETLDQAAMGKLASRVLSEQVADLKRQLQEQAPARIAAVIAKMQQADCECRRKIEGRLKGLMEIRVGWRGVGAAQSG